MEKIRINGKDVGYIDGDTYYCDRDRSHLFLKYERGLGLSVSIIDYVESKGVINVCINFENRLLLKCPISLFYLKGTKFDFNYINKNTGKEVIDEQLILPNKYFNKKEVIENQEVLI